MEIILGMTFDEFVILKQKEFPDSTGELSKLLRDIALASKVINRDVNKAGLVDILGHTGSRNVQGEEVMKLDEMANETLIKYLCAGGKCSSWFFSNLLNKRTFPHTGNSSYPDTP